MLGCNSSAVQSYIFNREDCGGKPVVHNVRFVTGVEKDLEIVQSWWEQRERQKKENFLGKNWSKKGKMLRK